MWLNSTLSFFRKLRRAGTLKKRFFTESDVPAGQTVGCWLTMCEPSITTCVPSSLSCCRVRSSTWAMAAMEASASPRKPMVWMAKRSSARCILLVACRSKQRRASLSLMPLPLSMTCINVRPASFTTRSIWVAPASIEFSSNSFTAPAGRSTTSPAAIWLATLSGNMLIISILLFYSYTFLLPHSSTLSLFYFSTPLLLFS